jgi:hypothetical protein
MYEAYMPSIELPARDASYHAKEQCEHGLRLVPVEMPADAEVVQFDDDVFGRRAALLDAFVHERDVTGAALKSFDDRRRRCEHVVEQADLAQVRSLREVEAEQFVIDCVGDRIEESNLRSYWQSHFAALDLRDRHSRLFQERRQVNACLACARAGFARQQAVRIGDISQ